MNLIIDCPHCHAEVSVPANVKTACPHCKQPVIAEGMPRAAKTPRWQVAFVLLVSMPVVGWWFIQKIETPRAPDRESHRIEYRVSGDGGRAMVTMVKPDGGIEQHDAYHLPWSREFTAATGTHLSISAQNQAKHGEVTVSILVNGIMVKGVRATADYGIASTQAVVP